MILFYRAHEQYRRLGFPTISAVGAHAAMIRYIPTIKTDKQITRQEIYLLNAATQYKGNLVGFFVLQLAVLSSFI